ncbi:glycerol-3-phosphate acyltransferase [Spirulina subsalsa FACHB-351]|uniref:Glycerol-3-phosphate acyltransferase n=1 Tax=Spirulina subsalsa FACHB-351 TaxID=234711 RepID=A0ABT3L2R3_9CYAN|nr:glycerol-3-phosphate acyltransferase [Spirulina subsalsa]MCW6035379.1 glycerol-3-phosphate acyltransferase [Spirulina subsalsa FACHB-351]
MLQPIWGLLTIFILCPLLGGLPVIGWLTKRFTRQDLGALGTGNVSVSAAFYHGGVGIGLLAVLSEALKGILAVLLARYFFPQEPALELVALFAVVMGRYWVGKGAGTTNVGWGMIVHSWQASLFILLLGVVSFTLFRDRQSGRFAFLFLLPLVLGLLYPQDGSRIFAAIALALLLAWIYYKIPDDLDLPEQKAAQESQTMFRFFRGDQAILTLQDRLDPRKVGKKAATLAQLKRWGYAVPEGWVIPAGDDPQPLILSLDPSPTNPLIVRSSALGEDTETTSAAGQYLSIAQITDSQALEEAILQCQRSYNRPHAIQYRRDRLTAEGSLAVIVQKQIPGVFSGVAFSRDPVRRYDPAVVIEALPGDAAAVVSGRRTPERYRLHWPETPSSDPETPPEIPIEGTGNIPPNLLREVAAQVRELEERFFGIPQDMEWSYDGQQLWILQSRPITNLQPIWTRKIAAEVIPGVIRPLTWSINRPLTCGVWGDIFQVVLGERAQDIDFTETATLHYSRAYFNASLLGHIFRLMGLPAESLEFLTRGAKFSRPPLTSTLRNLPGLWALWGRERQLEQDFEVDLKKRFLPTLNQLQYPDHALSDEELLARVDLILSTLKRATYYSILSPLSVALRRALLRVKVRQLDNSQAPEIASTRALAQLALKTRNLLPMSQLHFDSCPSLFAYLAEIPDGENVLAQFQQWLDRYGYLSEVITDIAYPRWREEPRPMRELFTQCLLNDQRRAQVEQIQLVKNPGMRARLVQQRVNLQNQVAEIYAKLLAHLRWTIVTLEQRWLDQGKLSEGGDIFFLELEEIRTIIEEENTPRHEYLADLIAQRRSHWQQDKALSAVPYIVYGKPQNLDPLPVISPLTTQQTIQGIAASPGQVEGQVKILRHLPQNLSLPEKTILVVPYTDAGWSPLLAQVSGLISEVGGILSHGAIVAREYGIPAVMDIPHATEQFQEGQWVRLNGETGQVEILA